jgi:hypothetical protein
MLQNGCRLSHVEIPRPYDPKPAVESIKKTLGLCLLAKYEFGTRSPGEKVFSP